VWLLEARQQPRKTQGLMMDDEDDKKLPAAIARRPEGTFIGSGNPSGRPLGAATRFSRELREAFGEHFNSDAPGTDKTKGQDAMERVWKEKPDAYLALAVKLTPQQLLVETNRALGEMPDDELLAIVVAAKRKQ
jgi:hypothetical protein